MTGDEFARLLNDFTRSAESGDGGVAMAQLGVEPERMTKVFRRWTGWLKERPETKDYLARPKGSRAKNQ